MRDYALGRVRQYTSFIFLICLLVTAPACNGSAGETPTSIPTMSPPATLTSIPTPLATTTPTPPPTPSPTATPNVTETPIIPSACPPPGNPGMPARPDTFDDYPEVLADYLSQGSSAEGLENLLRTWEAIREDAGEVQALDLTGDRDAEIVVSLIDPLPEFDLPWPSGDLFIFQCQAGGMILAYRGRYVGDEVLYETHFGLQKIADVNDTGLPDVVYTTSTCGAHTCWDQIYVVEWDGQSFLNRVPALETYPYPSFTVEHGRILVQSGGIGSAGAGVQRGYDEIWSWNGQVFTHTETIIGPPLVLVHYAHDGDESLARGDYVGAIEHYQRAIDDASMSSGLFFESEEQGVPIVRAYARFKLAAAYAAAGDEVDAETQYNLLLVEHPEGTPGYPFASLAQAFWLAFSRDGDPKAACAAAVAVAETDPTPADMLYAGYGNPDYEPADLCRLPDW